MKLTRMKAASVAALLSVFALTSSGARAAGSTPLIGDGDGVDYDAACVLNTDLPPAAGPDAVGSPGTSPCADGSGVSTYDGSTESTDIRDVALASDPNGRFMARCTLDGPIVPAGSPVRPMVDVPESNTFVGASCKVMFQNVRRQNNLPTNNAGGGCPRAGGGVVFDVHGAWQDGFHFFIGFSQLWDGRRWVHSAQIGEYDPSPDGGFAYYEIGTNDGTGWAGPAAVAIAGGTVTITIDGVTTSANANCATGFFNSVWARPGDPIINVKGLSSADTSMALPVTVPGNLAVDDVRAVGGYTWFSDTTIGASTPGLFGTNIPGIAYTTGLFERARGGSTMSQGIAQGQAADGPRTCCDPVDTLGEGPTCPTPTFGGTLPNNPMFTPATACHIDDDAVSRGSFLPEFWDTPFGFAF
jgi:hypothetical protein